MAKKATPKKTPATKAAPKKAAPKKKALAAKKVAPKKAAPKKAARKKAAPKKAVAKKTAPKKAVAKKAAPKKAAPKKAVAKKAAAPKVTRRDHAGHIDPSYARDLLAKSGGRDVDGDDGAFLGGKKKRRKDPLADELGKEFVETVTSGEDEGTEIRDGKQVEELGGPFIRTNASQEFAYDPDASNPKGARREPFPKT